MTRATIGLAVAAANDPLLSRFLAVLTRWCTVRHADNGDRVDAWLATDNWDRTRIGPDVPVLVWTRRPQEAARDWPSTAILIGPRLPLGTVGAHRSLPVPDPGVDASGIPYVAPLVRKVWRRRFGLPSDMVVRLDAGGGHPRVPAQLQPTALAVAAVVVATGDDVLTSLAWGAPTVTDLQTARRLGLGDAVRAVEAYRLAEAATEAAQSEVEMAALAWKGRQLVEAHFDLAGAAYRAAEAAGVSRGGSGPRAVVFRLNELWATPRTAWSIVREIGS